MYAGLLPCANTPAEPTRVAPVKSTAGGFTADLPPVSVMVVVYTKTAAADGPEARLQ